MDEATTTAIGALGALATGGLAWARQQSAARAARATERAKQREIDAHERAEMRRDLAALLTQVRDLGSQVNAHERALLERDRQIGGLRDELADYREQLESATAALAAAQERLQQLEAELEEGRAVADELRADIDQARQHADQLAAQVASLGGEPAPLPPRPERARNSKGQFIKKRSSTK